MLLLVVLFFSLLESIVSINAVVAVWFVVSVHSSPKTQIGTDFYRILLYLASQLPYTPGFSGHYLCDPVTGMPSYSGFFIYATSFPSNVLSERRNSRANSVCLSPHAVRCRELFLPAASVNGSGGATPFGISWAWHPCKARSLAGGRGSVFAQRCLASRR